jgi:hypothetical protein
MRVFSSVFMTADHLSALKCLAKYLHSWEVDKGACSISSTPHSSASHHNSAVLVELRSTTGMNFPILLTRSTKSLQLPSLRASSVMTRSRCAPIAVNQKPT